MEHDQSYKLLFSHPQMLMDLLRGFVKEPWVDMVDFTTLELVNPQHLSDDLRRRDNDLIWRVRWQDTWFYIYLLLEFQSTVDAYMAVRLWGYEAFLYQDLIRTRQLLPEGKLPPVVPIVLYNGQRRWTAATSLATLLSEVPAGLQAYRPALSYLLIDESTYTEAELAPLRNLAAALFRIENSQLPADVQRVLALRIAWLRDTEHDSLRRAFTVWLKRVFLPGRLPGENIPEINNLEEMHAMLAERVIEWTQQWKAEGLQQAREAERRILIRIAEKRFGEVCAQELAPLLASIESQEHLVDIAEWIVTYDTGAVFLARVREFLR